MKKNIFTSKTVIFLILFSVVDVRPALSNWLDEYATSCYSDGLVRYKAFFAPMRERKSISKNLKNDSLRWGAYQFDAKNQNYPDGKYAIKSGKRNTIWMARGIELDIDQIDKARSLLPKFVWHVISTPPLKNTAKPMNGMIVNGGDFGALIDNLPWKENALPKPSVGNLRKHIKLSNIPFMDIHGKLRQIPLHNDAKKERPWINDIWRGMIGSDALNELVIKSKDFRVNNSNAAYSHTFYFWPIAEADKLGPQRLREASYRRVVSPGRVYGFILDPQGICLDSDIIDVVDR